MFEISFYLNRVCIQSNHFFNSSSFEFIIRKWLNENLIQKWLLKYWIEVERMDSNWNQNNIIQFTENLLIGNLLINRGTVVAHCTHSTSWRKTLNEAYAWLFWIWSERIIHTIEWTISQNIPSSKFSLFPLRAFNGTETNEKFVFMYVCNAMWNQIVVEIENENWIIFTWKYFQQIQN